MGDGGGGGSVGGFRGSGQHLDDLFEGRGISLDEGCWVRISGFGSGDGFGRGKWWLMVVESIISGGGAAVAAAATMAVRRGKKRLWVVIILVFW